MKAGGEASHSIQFLPIKFKLKIWFDEEMNENERSEPANNKTNSQFDSQIWRIKWSLFVGGPPPALQSFFGMIDWSGLIFFSW